MEDVKPENSIRNVFNSTKLLSPIQQMILIELTKEGPLSRRQLVLQLNTPRTTIYDNLIKLQKRKVIEKFTRNNRSRGRPLVYWKLV